MHFPGDFVQLDGVHLWDNVKVDNGCNISKSILCKNVHIKRYRTCSFRLVTRLRAVSLLLENLWKECKTITLAVTLARSLVSA